MVNTVGKADSIAAARKEETSEKGLFAIYGTIVPLHFGLCLYWLLINTEFQLRIPIELVSDDLKDSPGALAFYGVLICAPVYALGLSALLGIVRQRSHLPFTERLPSLLGFAYKYRPSIRPFAALVPIASFLGITLSPMLAHTIFLNSFFDRSQVCESYHRATCKDQRERGFDLKPQRATSGWLVHHQQQCSNGGGAVAKRMACDITSTACIQMCTMRFARIESSESAFWPSLAWMLTYSGNTNPAGSQRIDAQIMQKVGHLTMEQIKSDIFTKEKNVAKQEALGKEKVINDSIRSELVFGKRLDFIPIFMPYLVLVFELIVIWLVFQIFRHWFWPSRYKPKPTRQFSY